MPGSGKNAAQADPLDEYLLSFKTAAPATQPEVPPAPAPASGVESFARGGVQGASAGLSDEAIGAAKAMGIDPLELTAALAGGPASLGSYIGNKIGLSFGSKDIEDIADEYRGGRDAERAANKKAEQDNPRSYLGGQITGGVVGGAATAPATVAGTIGAGAAYGAAAGLGESEADLTDGEFKEAAKDTLKGAAVGAGGASVGVGLTRAVEATRGLATRLSKDKMIDNLGKYLEGIVKRGGDPVKEKKVAGQMMQRAIEQAGDARVPLGNLNTLADDLVKLPTNRRNKVADDVLETAARFRDNGATLGEMHAELKHWGQLAKDLREVDPAAARFANLAKDAIKKEVDGLSPSLTGATEYLAGRADYAKAAAADDVLKKLKNAVNPLSEGGEALDPRKFAALNSGKKKEQIEGWLKNDPEALKAWRMGAEAARVLARRGERWLPKVLRDQLPEPALKMADNLFTSFDVTRAFTDPEMARDFAQLVLPGRNVKIEKAVNLISRMSARLSDDAQSVATARAVAKDIMEDRPKRKKRLADASQQSGFTMNPANLQQGYSPTQVPR